jgi:hypothetical protein
MCEHAEHVGQQLGFARAQREIPPAEADELVAARDFA